MITSNNHQNLNQISNYNIFEEQIEEETNNKKSNSKPKFSKWIKGSPYKQNKNRNNILKSIRDKFILSSKNKTVNQKNLPISANNSLDNSLEEILNNMNVNLPKNQNNYLNENNQIVKSDKKNQNLVQNKIIYKQFSPHKNLKKKK